MKKINPLWLWDRLDNIGGVETLLLNMAKHLDRSRVNLYMGVFKTGYVASYFKEAITKKKHFTIYNGIDVGAIDKIISAVDKNRLRKSLSISEEDIILLLTAWRLTEQKGHCYLIAAMNKIIVQQPMVKLLIFGEWKLRQEFEKLIVQSHLSKIIFK